jgi:hypothetical protein
MNAGSPAVHVAAIREALGRLMIPDYESLAALDALVGLLQQAEREAEGSQRDADRWAHIAAADSARAVEAVARAERAEQERDELAAFRADFESKYIPVSAYDGQVARVRVLEEALREVEKFSHVKSHPWRIARRALAAAAAPQETP